MSDPTRIDPRAPQTGGVSAPASRPREAPLVAQPPVRRRRRDFFDPRDVEAAIQRLATLLAGDVDGFPRQDVAPRGYYLDILV